ncbi:MAG: hypothetical protein CSYNP_01375 [Syntrophus sp. SKADARSKE-3]|nr:hypothetical protein [Syntrophus sp. SKADARSKE-3]
MHKHSYCTRTYRNKLSHQGFESFQVKVLETDLYIAACKDLTKLALKSVQHHRMHIENYIKLNPLFLKTFSPWPDDPLAPPIVRNMISAANQANVGPMAAVAGAVADYVGLDLMAESPEVIVENGGDIFMKCERQMCVGIFAGPSPLSDKLTIIIDKAQMPIGICTSSATVGPSVSLGCADAVCILAKSAALADAVASFVGNKIRKKDDIQRALDQGAKIKGVTGMVIIMDKHLGAWGDVTFA